MKLGRVYVGDDCLVRIALPDRKENWVQTYRDLARFLSELADILETHQNRDKRRLSAYRLLSKEEIQ